MHSFFPEYLKHLSHTYPNLLPNQLTSLSPQLASPLRLSLPVDVLSQAQLIVSDLYKLTQNRSYQQRLQENFSFKDFQKTPSLLNSLDVHVDEHQHLKIIEINTNASSYLVNSEHYLCRKSELFSDAKQKLKECFQKVFGSSLTPGKLFLVVDEAPEQQNMFIEFLMFRHFLSSEFGVRCEVADSKDLVWDDTKGLLWKNESVSGIYNRTTDFFFKESPALHSAYQQSQTLISPNPWGYAQVADKNRLIEWSQSLDVTDYPHLSRALLKTYRFSQFQSADDLWSQRQRFFFKPPNAFGSRSVYKGKSISRTVFQRIYSDDYIAQEICPAPETVHMYQGQTHQFKYDLRFYFFEDEIQLAMGRLYQGQLTNLQTPLGGLTPLEFS